VDGAGRLLRDVRDARPAPSALDPPSAGDMVGSPPDDASPLAFVGSAASLIPAMAAHPTMPAPSDTHSVTIALALRARRGRLTMTA
jgi:hypothetical protein